MTGGVAMESIWRDLRYGVRGLAGRPSLTTAVVLLLALGLGASTAMFSVVDGVLLEPLDYEHSDRLVALFRHNRDRGERRNPTSAADFLDWRRESESLDLMTAAHPWAPSMTGRETPDRLDGLKASRTLFSLLGVKPAVGRVFVPGDDRVVVLGDSLWQRRFGGDKRIVGETLTLDGESYEVIGVMPPGFVFPPFWATEAELWAPLVFSEEQSADRRAQFLRVFARLKEGFDVEQARVELDTIAGRLETAHPDTNRNASVRVEPLHEPVVESVRPKIVVLFGAVGILLFVACANVAELLLVNASSRHREIAICIALGASRLRLVRAFLLESVLLSALGCAAGMFVAKGVILAIQALAAESLPRVANVALDARAFAFAAGLALVTGVLFGAAPALASARITSASPRFTDPGRGRRALVVSQVSLAFMLLVGAGLLVRSFHALDALDPGFSRKDLITMDISFAGSSHEAPARQTRLFDEIQVEVESLPGVESAALVNHLPIGGDIWRTPFVPEGRELADDEPRASYRTVSHGFFRSLGARLESGRSFDERDTADSAPVVMVNRTLAARYFTGIDPIGRRIKLGGQGGPDSESPWLTIVGVVRDLRQWTLTADVQPEIFFPYSQNPVAWWTTTTLVARSSLEASSVAESVRTRVWQIDGSLPVTNVRTLEAILANDLRQPRLHAWLLGLFAVNAFLLAAIGIYGVVSHATNQRKREIGIRAALGAGPARIVSLVVGEGMTLVAEGTLLGGLGGLLSSRLLASFLFGVTATDPATFAAALVLLASVGALACYVPARRASRRPPVEALQGVR